MPLVVRLAGTNVEAGKKIIAESGIPIIVADTLAEAAEKAVAAYKSVQVSAGEGHMSILIDEKTPILVQGITGDKGSFHTKEMIDYGSNVVAGVTPGKGGKHASRRAGVQHRARSGAGDRRAGRRSPSSRRPFAADAIMEAADAGIRLICSITDGIPAQDMMSVKRYFLRFPKDRRPMMVGPNCAGIISPGKAMLGIMPGHIYKQGRGRSDLALRHARL